MAIVNNIFTICIFCIFSNWCFGGIICFVILFCFLIYIRNVIAGSYDSSIFSFLKSLHTVFHTGYTNLHFHQQCIEGSLFSNVYWRKRPHQRLFLVFLIIAILTGMRLYLTVVLICISLVINDVEHLFLCLLAIYMSSLERCLFKSSAHFLSGYGFFN